MFKNSTSQSRGDGLHNSNPSDSMAGNRFTGKRSPYWRGMNLPPYKNILDMHAVSVIGDYAGQTLALLYFLVATSTSVLEINKFKKYNSRVEIALKTHAMAKAIVELSGITFQGSSLIIRHQNTSHKGIKTLNRAYKVKAIKDLLQRRYLPSQRLLDLSQMNADMGFLDNDIQAFGARWTSTKFPTVIFRIARSLGIDPITLILNNNDIVHLDFIDSLGTHLPTVTNISFQSNVLFSYSSLNPLKQCKSLNIEMLNFNDNPFKSLESRDSIYRTKIIEMLPSLKSLDGIPIPTQPPIHDPDSTELYQPGI
ncbi:nuclear mRNA export, poly(A)+RNA binding protein [Entomophthora muscae]|uniref:Nuclear mRNA export, poly(A)+RNA binding protein n=1 Tax=Entomophthora muscae TaxID=34485 RepID=A0ACC2U0E0_9FUNG|nr:nuclear mRNA export, poly(A)+RNA binding protein [Entomophthora muscae]